MPQQQGGYEDDIKKGDPKEASKKQDVAINQLEKATTPPQELEKRLKASFREKELAKLLQNLEERVNRMLKMQIEVKGSTEGIHKTVTAVLGGKAGHRGNPEEPGRGRQGKPDHRRGRRTLKLMEGEGTAVVFAGVLNQVKGDMEAIQRHFNEARVGEDTQQIEQDVIDQLKMMAGGSEEGQAGSGKQAERPRSRRTERQEAGQQTARTAGRTQAGQVAIQEQVNKRTVMFSNKQDPGEQAEDPLHSGRTEATVRSAEGAERDAAQDRHPGEPVRPGRVEA